MRIIIRPELRKAIKQAFESDLTDAESALNALNLRTASIESIQKAKEAYDKALENAKLASRLVPGTEADYNATTGQLTWGEAPDNRPSEWWKGWSYQVPSRSGNRPHEVTINQKGETGCNCEGSRFGEVCWARKEAKKRYDANAGFSVPGFAGWNRVIGSAASDFGRIID